MRRDEESSSLCSRLASTEEQARHGYSIGAQVDSIRAYAKEHGYQIVGEYVDEGISARKPYKKRPALLSLLEAVEADRVDVILFIKLDRWFRNVAAYHQVQPILEKHNVAWQATLEDYETVTASGRFKVNIMLSVAEDEADRTAERIRFVQEAKRAKGEWLNDSVLIGYKLEDKKVVPDPEQLPIIEDLFQTFIDYRSCAVCRDLLHDKYKINRSFTTIRWLLHNKRYIELIGHDQFQRAQEILQTRSQRNAGRTGSVFLFTSIIYCKECGGRVKAGRVKGTAYYSCYLHDEFGSYRCRNRKHLPEHKIESFLLENLESAAKDRNAEIAAETKPKKDKARIQKKMDKLKDLYLDDLISKEIYEKDYRALESELYAWEPQQIPIDLSSISDAVKMYSTLTMENKKAFWSRTVKRIEIDASGQIFLIL